MALSEKRKGIRDNKLTNIAGRLKDLTEKRDRLVLQHTALVGPIQDEIDGLTLMQDALTALK